MERFAPPDTENNKNKIGNSKKCEKQLNAMTKQVKKKASLIYLFNKSLFILSTTNGKPRKYTGGTRCF
jgi:hypothetical protein